MMASLLNSLFPGYVVPLFERDLATCTQQAWLEEAAARQSSSASVPLKSASQKPGPIVGARPSKGHSRLTVKTLPVRDGPNYEAAASGDVQLAQKRACRQELGWKRSALPEVLTSAVPDLPLLILGSRAPKMRVKARSGNGPEPGLASLIRARGDRALSVSFDRRQSPVCFIRSDSLRS